MKPVRIDVPARFLAATWQSLVTDEHGTEEYFSMRGAPRVFTLFKLYRNARKAADRPMYRRRGPPKQGVVLWYAPELLPVVHPDESLEQVPGLPDRLSELEFAERQMQLWADVVAKLSTGRADLIVPDDEQLGLFEDKR